ncbi:hypothetical protein GGR57DRAFT_23333 [Xylariaceae sp. FL1272]|nr:hypothetical protein GGR57DRAFT_23333 [Xylariaceae sp. FL1272]
MADQCIVCLDNLDVHDTGHGYSTAPLTESNPTIGVSNIEATPSPTLTLHLKVNDSNTTNLVATSPRNDEDTRIAVIQVCGHVLHDACLREWTGKANSCPICRQTFHLVHVYDKVGGTLICSYKVEDKKQVAEFDPQAWLDENPEEEEESHPCPICNLADHEEVLLLCDNCDTPYHTYCVGLDSVPRGHWFCLECAEEAAQLLAAELDEPDVLAGGLSSFSDGQSDYLPRTQATMRRARQRARSDEWQGAWGQITGHVWDVLNIDLDNHDDDESFHNYRRSQQRSERERREYQRWQQRLNIASRLGAHDVFAENLSRVIPQRMARPPPPPPPPQETPEEAQAWGALEKAMEAESPNRPTTSHRKRKSRSVTASPAEPPTPQERRLKRPRTRRVPTQAEGSSSNPVSTTQGAQSSSAATSSSNGTARSPLPVLEGPTFLSSLLKEVEMSTPSDDENIQLLFARTRPSTDPLSPITSPSPSAHSSPRALSTTPPPRSLNERPGSPLSLMSRIEPVYPPANFNAFSRNGGEHSDSESRSRPQHSQHGNGATHTTEIRQPRPRRQRPSEMGTAVTRSSDVSPSRLVLPFEMKESISGIVKDALKPHWKSGQLTADQYANINRDLSHKLYREVSEQELDDEARSRFEKIANKEVARAVEDLKA